MRDQIHDPRILVSPDEPRIVDSEIPGHVDLVDATNPHQLTEFELN
jgi:hypothetical protein